MLNAYNNDNKKLVGIQRLLYFGSRGVQWRKFCHLIKTESMKNITYIHTYKNLFFLGKKQKNNAIDLQT
jgi:hypothetical protein